MKKMIMVMLCITVSVSALAQNCDAIVGKWLNPSGEGQVQIYKKGDKFFGKLAWIKFPNDEAGKPKTDKLNPDPALKSRPELGLELLQSFTCDGNTYVDGTIYDPKSGKTYSCKMTLKGDVLKIRGYIGISLLGRTEEWTKVK
ncbi:uncharacterized protein DUF2147 [Mucilaginibacter gracilis]|uniref:Uncharacterized protein DUF2147 n=1 Tax=Mucilaginibacter gracilis TaxID=423350 RepID=A0A495J9P8_9SPHI|nr:DUF2147 domain-containing protein [Mucilaginibacter gracilis]RKR85208.1 uncharacterized protein DUF2147 [Mucilaginibacter gracilis]